MNSTKAGRKSSPTRQHKRFYFPPGLTVRYEGRVQELTLHNPAISAHGMFINTSVLLPEGAVLQVSFILPQQKVLFAARCEVRYCLRGVGVGVEFLDLGKDERRAIELEVESLCEAASEVARST